MSQRTSCPVCGQEASWSTRLGEAEHQRRYRPCGHVIRFTDSPEAEWREAADRVAQYLAGHADLGGPIDHEVLHRIGVRGTTYDLLASDLRTLLGVLGVEVRPL